MHTRTNLPTALHFHPQHRLADEGRFLAGAALEIRRLCNLALAFIRQVHMQNKWSVYVCVGIGL